MTTMPKRAVAVLALLASLTVGACGSSATSPSPAAIASAAPTATLAPTATPAPTASPTASPSPTLAPTATPSPTPDPSQGAALFKFAPADVLAYYKGTGFKCDAQNTALTGYVIQQCHKVVKNTPTSMVSLAWSTADGGIQYGYAGYYNKDGAKKPDPKAAAQHLGAFIGALLGTDDGTPVAQWSVTNFGSKVKDTYKGLEVFSYPLDSKPGSGYFFEIATPEFLKAVGG
jgi:hypothetical protein